MQERRPTTVYEEWLPFWVHQSVAALARLVGQPLEWHAGAPRYLSTPTLPTDVGNQVLVYVQTPDPGCRLWVVGWPEPAADQLLQWLLPIRSRPSRPRWEMDGLVPESSIYGSALLEAGNVMAGTFFTAIAGYMNRALVPAPPGLIVGDAATCQARLQDLTATEAGTWVLIEGRLTGAGRTCPQWVGVFIHEGVGNIGR